MCSYRASIEYNRLGWHVSVHYSEFLRVRGPCNIVYRTILVYVASVLQVCSVTQQKPTEIDPRVKPSVSAQEIKSCFAIIAFARLVDLRLCEHYEVGTFIIPLQLHFVPFEERLLGHCAIKVRDIKDLHCGRLTLGYRQRCADSTSGIAVPCVRG